MTQSTAQEHGEEPGDVLADFDLPDSYTPDAVEAFREVLTIRPGLAGPELVALENAGHLISNAERLEALAREAGYVSKGSQGQDVLHFGVQEARQARVAAAHIMSRLTVVVQGPRQTNSERGRAAAAARWGASASRSRGGR